jgi:hypothetical protein
MYTVVSIFGDFVTDLMCFLQNIFSKWRKVLSKLRGCNGNHTIAVDPHTNQWRPRTARYPKFKECWDGELDIIEILLGLYFFNFAETGKKNSSASQFMQEIPLPLNWIRKNRTKKREKKREPGEIRIRMNMCRMGSCKVGCSRAAVVAIPHKLRRWSILYTWHRILSTKLDPKLQHSYEPLKYVSSVLSWT